MRLIERVWSGDSAADRVARVVLAPLEGLYRSALAVRRELYDRGIFRIQSSPVPVISVGNLTVGGTGKTPVSAWLAERLTLQGRSPAMVLRGYGDDEPKVHARLNPHVPVIVARDRREGIAEAASGGADVVILDDAFQHRRAARDLDLVLVSADAWTGRQRVLPAGPFREPLSELRRASAILVTRKAATAEQVAEVVRAVRAAAVDKPVITLRLLPSALVLHEQAATTQQANALGGRRVLAIAGIADTAAFFGQLELLGATVTPRPYPDHHAFTQADVAQLVNASAGFDYVVCTLKDAVKLGRMWPASGAALWYVSLSVEVESGEAALDELLLRLPWVPQPHTK